MTDLTFSDEPDPRPQKNGKATHTVDHSIPFDRAMPGSEFIGENRTENGPASNTGDSASTDYEFDDSVLAAIAARVDKAEKWAARADQEGASPDQLKKPDAGRIAAGKNVGVWAETAVKNANPKACAQVASLKHYDYLSHELAEDQKKLDAICARLPAHKDSGESVKSKSMDIADWTANVLSTVSVAVLGATGIGFLVDVYASNHALAVDDQSLLSTLRLLPALSLVAAAATAKEALHKDQNGKLNKTRLWTTLVALPIFTVGVATFIMRVDPSQGGAQHYDSVSVGADLFSGALWLLCMRLLSEIALSWVLLDSIAERLRGRRVRTKNATHERAVKLTERLAAVRIKLEEATTKVATLGAAIINVVKETIADINNAHEVSIGEWLRYVEIRRH